LCIASGVAGYSSVILIIVCTGLSNNNKQDVITRGTNTRCSTRVFFAILNFFDTYFINCRHRSVAGRPYYFLLWGDKTCSALHFQHSQCSVFGKNVADLNKKYVPCQVSTFISLPIVKERKIAIGFLCSLIVILDQSGTKLRYPTTFSIYIQCEFTNTTEQFQRQGM
jgi:hypothetical protein